MTVATGAGEGHTDDDAAAAIAMMYCPIDKPFYYFEVKVLDQGREGFIGIGLATEEVLLNRLPGWERSSFGYHGDDGNAFHGHGKGSYYAHFVSLDASGKSMRRLTGY